MSVLLTRAALVAAARGWIGTPYHHQASLRGVGCDCLGLVRGVWRECLGPEPEQPGPYSPDWAEATGIEQLAQAGQRHLVPRVQCLAGKPVFSPGDVLLFRWRVHVPAKHLAIVTGPAGMVHAHDGACVAEVALTPWWLRHLAYVFAFPGVG